jgi:hypothetical protein
MTAPVLTPPRLPVPVPSPLHALGWEPIEAALATIRADAGTADATAGLAKPFFVENLTGWLPADALTGGDALTLLLGLAARRWSAQPHAAATLAWKSYSYWASLPMVLGWASARRFPLLTAEQTLVSPVGDNLRFGARSPLWAVLPTDPLARSGHPCVRVVADETALLALLRETLLDQHLDPLLDAIRDRVRLGRRTLLGSVASGIAWGLIRASDGLPGSIQESLETLLTALDLDDLVDIGGTPTGLIVQRKTCCLAFTLDKPKVCTGCCIR